MNEFRRPHERAVYSACAPAAPTGTCASSETEGKQAYGDNNSGHYATRGTVGAVGATICGYISNGYDNDFYRYDIPATKAGSYKLNFKFGSLGQTQYPEAYVVNLTDSRGNSLKSWSVSTSKWRGTNFTFKLPAGTSYVEIRGDHEQVRGNQYRLTLTHVAAKPKPEPAKTTFIDVSKSHKFYTEIEWMYAAKISTGNKTSKGLSYKPSEKVTREAMAAFLYRMKAPKSYTPKRQHFDDVPKGHKFYKQIEWMYDQGISTGNKRNGKLYYAPGEGVSREAMAAFLYRAQGTKKAQTPAVAPFPDVPRTHKFAKEIAWMKAKKISTGTTVNAACFTSQVRL